MSEEVISLIKFDSRAFSTWENIPEPTEEELELLKQFYDKFAEEKLAALMFEIFSEKLFYRFTPQPKVKLNYLPFTRMLPFTIDVTPSIISYGY